MQAALATAAEALAPGSPPPSAPVLLRRLFERLGASYIKLGQFIASSPTLFPDDYVLGAPLSATSRARAHLPPPTEFQKCLDRTPPTPFEQIKAIMEAELGQPLSALYESVDPVPLASASVAQVHAAVLRGSRKEVAIKVLKPGAEEALSTDLAFLAVGARVLEWLAPDLERASLAAVAGDLRASMLNELDFTLEAGALRSFRAYLEATGNDGCTAPYVYPAPLSSRRVMTMERLRGVPLTDLAAIKGPAAQRGMTPEAVLIDALNAWAGSVLQCESFHADLHAGNLLVLRDGRVAFIDFGIVGRISPATWGAASALLGATQSGDWRTAAQALVTMGAAGVGERAVDVDAFGADLGALEKRLRSVRATVSLDSSQAGPAATVAVDEADANAALLELVRVADRHGVKFPREFTLLLRNVLYFDRYRAALAPDLDVLTDPRVRLRAVPR